MSKATKRKHVIKEVLGDYITPNEKQQIMKIMRSNGNNLHEAVTESGERFLLSMPTKFRKNIWIKRGDFVIVDPIEEGDKVKGEINFILYRDHIHHLRKLGLWPEGFDAGEQKVREQKEVQKDVQKDETKSKAQDEDEGDSSDSEDERDLFVNTNRITVQYGESDEDSDDDGGDEDQDEERA